MLARVRRWSQEVLGGDRDPAFVRETAEVNRRRIRVFAPLMAVVHLAHVANFATLGADRALLAPDVLRWRDGLVVAHAAMLPIVLVGGWIAYRSRSEALLRWLGPVVATLWLLHGAACASLDQLVVTNITAYVAYCLGIPVIYCLAPRATVAAYGIAAGAMATGLVLLQRQPEALASTLPAFTTVTVVGIVLSWSIHATRRREFAQRAIIERQREELATLNAGLEQRVREQVAEIVAHARNVDRLYLELQQANAWLQAQVRSRSVELSLALDRLAQGRDRDDRLPPGTELGERFVVERLLGAGGMGAVYAGRDRSTGTRVAIKVIQTSSTHELDLLRRFLREPGAAATISHPAVVRMLHLDVSGDGLVFQVQELVEGETLAQRMRGPWSPAHAARLVAVLCDALAAAHAEGIAHLDVKPGNLMLTPTAPGLKLLDFGIARLYAAIVRGGESTRAGRILGTPAYMAPEQANGRAQVTDRADVYSAGILLFRLVTGCMPFEADTPSETLRLHLLEVPPDVRALVPSIPETLALLIARCLAKSPDVRPDAHFLSTALATFADTAGAPLLEAIPRPAHPPSEPTLDPSSVLAGP